jgi:hypothetical protein
VIAAAGIAFLAVGVFLWSRKQIVLDQKDRLETEKLRREVENMSPAQIAEKAIKEAEEGSQVEEARERTWPRSLIEEYFRIESILISKLIACFGQERVLPHQRVQQTEYDAVVLSGANTPDVIFEVKLARSRYHYGRVRETLDRLILATQTYMAATEYRATAIGLFILLYGNPESMPIHKYREMAGEKAETHRVDIQVHFITKDDLIQLGCNDLRSMMYGKKSGVIKA